MYAAGLLSATPEVAITAEMLQPIIDGVQANVAVILPVGLGLMAVMLGVRLVPTLLRTFIRG